MKRAHARNWICVRAARFVAHRWRVSARIVESRAETSRPGGFRCLALRDLHRTMMKKLVIRRGMPLGDDRHQDAPFENKCRVGGRGHKPRKPAHRWCLVSSFVPPSPPAQAPPETRKQRSRLRLERQKTRQLHPPAAAQRQKQGQRTHAAPTHIQVSPNLDMPSCAHPPQSSLPQP